MGRARGRSLACVVVLSLHARCYMGVNGSGSGSAREFAIFYHPRGTGRGTAGAAFRMMAAAAHVLKYYQDHVIAPILLSPPC